MFKFFIKIKFFIYYYLLGIGVWGLGIGDWAQSPIPNPQSPIPNPHEYRNSLKICCLKLIILFDKLKLKKMSKVLDTTRKATWTLGVR